MPPSTVGGLMCVGKNAHPSPPVNENSSGSNKKVVATHGKAHFAGGLPEPNLFSNTCGGTFICTNKHKTMWTYARILQQRAQACTRMFVHARSHTHMIAHAFVKACRSETQEPRALWHDTKKRLVTLCLSTLGSAQSEEQSAQFAPSNCASFWWKTLLVVISGHA